MDPATGILGIASAAVTLAALALKVGQTLKTMVATYTEGAALLYSLIGACQAIELAWNRINIWIGSQSAITHARDSPFYDQLAASIEVGKVVLGALQRDLGKYAEIKPGQNVYSRFKVLLNDNILQDHSARLNLQVSSLNLLLATASLPMPEARNVLCDCLQSIFRRDEESAWTIVASAPRSSIHTTESVPSDMRADNDIRYPIKHFSFINDLLTAPVYKRLTINMLSRPRTAQCPEAVLPSNHNWHLSHRASPSAPSRAPSCQGSATITTRRQTVPSASSAHTGEGHDSLDLIDRAAGKSFSFSAVSDLWGFSTPQSDPKSQRYLPIRAILNREQMTVEERLALDLNLIGATRRGLMYEMAASLDSGADINAAPSPMCETCLHVAVTTCKDERVVLFLLQYNNVNVHVRNGNGRTVLHGAVSNGKAETVRRLLELGGSMTEEDENGITPFNIAIDKLTSPTMLLMLLRHARKQGANDEHITSMDLTALHTACKGYPVDVAKALVLLEYGWSPKHRFHTVDRTGPERMSPLYLAVLKKETVLVERMLELEESVFRINAVHGPYPSLLKLALEDSGSGAAMILLLLRAGVDYISYLPDLYGVATQENYLPLLRWLDNKTRPRIVVRKLGGEPKVREVISPWPQLPPDTEFEHWSEKRKSAIGLAISCETSIFLSTGLVP